MRGHNDTITRRGVLGALAGVGLSTAAASAMAATQSGLSASLAGPSSVAAGDTATVDVVLSGAGDGVAGIDLSLSVTGGTVTAARTSASGDALTRVDVAADGSGCDLQFVQSTSVGTGTVTVASVDVTRSAASVSVSLTVDAVSDPNGGSYAIADGTASATLSNAGGGPPTLPNAAAPAADPDGDGSYEDVDGDGQTGIGDVLAYYNNRDSAAVRNNPGKFDFDGDGVSGTVFDAVELYEQIR